MTKYCVLIIGLFLSVQIYSQCDPAAIFANNSTNAVCFEEIDNVRKCYTNNIPSHEYGPFGGGNTLEAQEFDYSMCLYPELGSFSTPLIADPSMQGCGNGIIFGVSAHGINYSPFARLYWVNPVTMEENVNFQIEADFTLNMDLNGGHVNAAQRYHYHNIPQEFFLNDLNIDGSSHSPIVGYAADGFPIYYKYLFTNETDANGGISAFQSSYSLKIGDRPGDGETAPNGSYDGNYVEDYEYISSLSALDECGGRFAITPEYPNGTYYYVLTENWPYIPRCLMGEHVDNSFRLGQNCPASTAFNDCSSMPTNVEEASTIIKLNVYPNPANDFIKIDLGNHYRPDQINGIKIYRSNASLVYYAEKFEEIIDLVNLEQGNYFIQIDFEGGQLTEKIIIQ